MIARLLDKHGDEIARTETAVFNDQHPIIFTVPRTGAGRRPVAMEVTVRFRDPPRPAPLTGDTVTVHAGGITQYATHT